MTAFDFIAVGIVGLSAVAAFVRGFTRVAVSLAAWVLGLVAALRFSSALAGMLPDLGGGPGARYVEAFVLIVLAVLIVGAIVGFVLSRLLQAVGLGFFDRFLGLILGLARGVVIVVFFVLVAGLSPLPAKDWWQNALLSPIFVTAALSLRPWLPKAWADDLDYSGKGRRPAAPAQKKSV
jgi:membrane protein required for colicin V production